MIVGAGGEHREWPWGGWGPWVVAWAGIPVCFAVSGAAAWPQMLVWGTALVVAWLASARSSFLWSLVVPAAGVILWWTGGVFWVAWLIAVGLCRIVVSVATSPDSAASVRQAAGVTDPTWRPPPAPDDTRGFVSPQIPRLPPWAVSSSGYAIDSLWRATRDLLIVEPRKCGHVTLAIAAPADGSDRYVLPAGTTLRLVETFDAQSDPRNLDLDWCSFNMFADGWSSRTYVVEDGRSAGIRLVLPTNPHGGRFPITATLAHAALEPVAEDVPEPGHEMVMLGIATPVQASGRA